MSTSNNAPKPAFTRNSDGTVTVEHFVAWRTRTCAQTARFDATVEVPAGRFTLRPTLIGGQPASYDDAYYFTVSVEGVLVSGGFDNENVGDVRYVHLMVYGYEMRKSVSDHLAIAQALASRNQSALASFDAEFLNHSPATPN